MSAPPPEMKRNPCVENDEFFRILQKGDPEDPIQRLSWADYEEQYEALFNPLKPDLEAQLMGVPPPPEERIVPKRTGKLRAPPYLPELLQARNAFTALEEPPSPESPHRVRRAWPPESSHSSGPSTQPSTSPSAVRPSPRPSAQTDSVDLA